MTGFQSFGEIAAKLVAKIPEPPRDEPEPSDEPRVPSTPREEEEFA